MAVLVAGGISSYSLASYRIGQLEKKTEVLEGINAKLESINTQLGDLKRGMEGIIEREIARSSRP